MGDGLKKSERSIEKISPQIAMQLAQLAGNEFSQIRSDFRNSFLFQIDVLYVG